MSSDNVQEYQKLLSRLAGGETLTPNEMIRFAVLANAAARNDERVVALSKARKGLVDSAMETLVGAAYDGFEMIREQLRAEATKDDFRAALTVVSTGDASESIRVGKAFKLWADDADSPTIEIVVRRSDLQGTADAVKTHAKRGANGTTAHGPVPDGNEVQ